MSVLTGLAVVTTTIEGVNYVGVCEDFTVTPANQLEDSSGVNARWEVPVAVKSSWTGSGNFKADDALASLAAKCVSSDIEVTFSLDTGSDTFSGTALLENVGHSIRNKGIQMRSVSLRGSGALTVA